MEDNVLTPYLLVNGNHILNDFKGNLRKQEFEFGLNVTGKDKFNLELEIVKMTVKSLKSNTSYGIGVVTAELIKSGTEKIYELLKQIFERCLNGDKFPNGLKIGYISVIHKKGKDENEN